MIGREESPLERRERLARQLSSALTDRAWDLTADLRGVFTALTQEEGVAIGLDDEVLAVRHQPTGEVFVVDVEIDARPYARTVPHGMVNG